MSSGRPLVSFVVLCYNTERYVGDCIRSILNLETDVSFEIVALDDHSPDGTFDVLRGFSDSRLTVIRNEKNLGHVLAMERAIHATKGNYLARIDSDDRYRPGFLKKVLPIFEKYPEVGMVYGDASMMGPEGQQYAPRCDIQHAGKDFKGCELIDLLGWNFICAPTIIAKRDLILQQFPIPRHLAFSDWYFTVKIARETEFYYVDSVIADYRVHGGNMHSRTVLDGSEENSIFWFLDQIYATEERTPELQNQKLHAKARVYGSHYRTLADKYFSAAMIADARRCYGRALRLRPDYVLDMGIVRRFAATVIGRSYYDRAKALFRSLTTGAGPFPTKVV